MSYVLAFFELFSAKNIMRKSVFGLAVAGTTLASAISSALPAGAVVYNYNSSNYNVTTYTGTFDSLQSTLTAADNLIWGNQSLASGLAYTVADTLGLPIDNAGYGPLFAYTFNTFLDEFLYANVNAAWLNGGVVDPNLASRTREFTYATATAVPVPWDISGSATIFGSITGIGLGVGLKRLQSKKNINLK